MRVRLLGRMPGAPPAEGEAAEGAAAGPTLQRSGEYPGTETGNELEEDGVTYKITAYVVKRHAKEVQRRQTHSQ